MDKIKCLKHQVLNSEKGAFSLLMILPIIALFAMVFLSMASLLNHIYSDAKRVNTNVSATVLRSNLLAYFKNNQAWAYMVQDNQNSSLACVKNGTACTAGAVGNGKIVKVYSPDNSVIFNENNAQNGFGLNGAPCANVQAGTDCPFRINATWQAVCDDGGACLSYQIRVIVRLELANNGSFPFDVAKHEINFVR